VQLNHLLYWFNRFTKPRFHQRRQWRVQNFGMRVWRSKEWGHSPAAIF